jgi:hypothetical protein
MIRIRICALLAIAVAAASSGPAFGQTEAIVRNLRLAADASGASLPQVEAGPGEKRYHLDAGISELHIAYDCTGVPGQVQLRLIQPPGTPLHLEDAACEGATTQVVTYSHSGPLPDNEYVVNLYVGDTEPFLADSLQFTVGAAVIPEGPDPAQATVPPAATVMPVPTSASGDDSGATGPDGPSWLLLVLAGAGILGLLAVVLWAAWSAMGKS